MSMTKKEFVNKYYETGGFKTCVITCTNTTSESAVDTLGNLSQ